MSELINSFCTTIKTMAEAWPAKMAGMLIGFVLSEMFQLHLLLFILFGALEFVDCLTKWLALAHEMLVDKDAAAKPTLWDCIRGIPAAHRRGYIKSEIMRKQFFDKMLTYLILILAAGIGDYTMRLTHRPDIFLSLVVAYISATEFISVLENLNEAGVSMAAAMLNFVKAKTKELTTGGGDGHDGPDQKA